MELIHDKKWKPINDRNRILTSSMSLAQYTTDMTRIMTDICNSILPYNNKFQDNQRHEISR